MRVILTDEMQCNLPDTAQKKNFIIEQGANLNKKFILINKINLFSISLKILDKK